jgi:hypothetical protein
MHPSKTVIFSMVVLGISLINAEKTVAIVPNVSIVPVVHSVRSVQKVFCDSVPIIPIAQ